MGNTSMVVENSKIEIEEVGSVFIVRLKGQITEDSALLEVLAQSQGREVIVDSSGLTRINSCGVRDWVRWVKGLEERSNHMSFIRCSPVVVAQLNMISNFAGAGNVLSIQAPFLCTECSEEKFIVLESRDLAASSALPEVSCTSCGAIMEFDEIPESYFEFAKSHSIGGAREEVVAVLNSI
jgi:anti-anti-sigma regulatory factor